MSLADRLAGIRNLPLARAVVAARLVLMIA